MQGMTVAQLGMTSKTEKAQKLADISHTQHPRANSTVFLTLSKQPMTLPSSPLPLHFEFF